MEIYQAIGKNRIFLGETKEIIGRFSLFSIK